MPGCATHTYCAWMSQIKLTRTAVLAVFAYQLKETVLEARIRIDAMFPCMYTPDSMVRLYYTVNVYQEPGIDHHITSLQEIHTTQK